MEEQPLLLPFAKANDNGWMYFYWFNETSYWIRFFLQCHVIDQFRAVEAWNVHLPVGEKQILINPPLIKGRNIFRVLTRLCWISDIESKMMLQNVSFHVAQCKWQFTNLTRKNYLVDAVADVRTGEMFQWNESCALDLSSEESSWNNNRYECALFICLLRTNAWVVFRALIGNVLSTDEWGRYPYKMGNRLKQNR